MSTYAALARAFLDLATRSPASQPEGDLAYLGYKPSGGIYAIKVKGRPNWVWVRMERGRDRTPTQAFNAAQVRRIPDCPVRVKTMNGVLHVIGYDAPSMPSFLGSTPLESSEPGTGSIEPVSTRRIMAGLMHCYKESGSYGLKVYVEPFAYRYNGEDKFWLGGALDLTAYMPATAGMQAWIKVGLNPITNGLVAVAGTEQSQLIALMRAGLDGMAFASYVALGGVKARQGQTAIDDERTLTDLRPWWTGSETAASGASAEQFRYVLQPQTAASDAALAGLAVGGSDFPMTVLAFDAATEEYGGWQIALPATLPGSFTATLKIHWSCGGSAGDGVVWKCVSITRADGETLGVAGNTDLFGTDTVIAASYEHSVSKTLTTTGWAAGELLLLKIVRAVGESGDTLASDAWLINALLEIS